MSTQVLLSLRLPCPGRVGDVGCQWNYAANSKRKRTGAFPSPSLQAVEARERKKSDKHSGPQPPYPSPERAAVWPIDSDQRALSEGTASWRAHTPAAVEG